ncbi:PspC domain-containing protein [Microbacterium sp. NPDC055665]
MTTLQRPITGRVIAGVCAGLAHRFGWKPTTMRVLFLVSCLLPGPQFLLYIALWILMPAATVAASAHRSTA